MYENKIVNTNIVIPPYKLNNYKDYIDKEVKKLENKIYSNDIGYIHKISKIISCDNVDIIKSDFSGSIIYKVIVEVQCFLPKEGEYIDCEVIQNENIVFATKEHLKIIVINTPNDLKINDNIKIQILCTEIDKNLDFIKIVGNFETKN
jgi:DNA-directed RNA polymerase subunit E'/Rpb7